ncbi:MAG: FAD-binding oxidoreductase [Azovibrio sp.]|nr:FAD-binding oxidoreductase [Azovibrio sp.]
MTALLAGLARFLPAERIVTDPLRRLAYGTDASFYRLVPEVVVIVEREAEVQSLLALAQALGKPVTFRAAGTSLSGQAVTDGILAVLGDAWRTAEIAEDGRLIHLGPAVVGADANRLLAPLGRKIGPDPASIATCKIGGIAANNASGMCCGTAQNTYQTLAGLRLILADGTLLDSTDPASRAAFRASHAALLDALAGLAREVRGKPELAARIEKKFRIKNTTGYSLNALIDFTDPIDILTHLMVGSEGTLGFLARVSYHTVEEHAHKASALVIFQSMTGACQAVMDLKAAPVAAVELMDRAALRAVEDQPGLPFPLTGLPQGATALLIETRASSAAALETQIAAIEALLAGYATLLPVQFQRDPKACDALWKIRKGTFPAVGAIRPLGSTVIIEDVAFPVATLAAAAQDLQALFAKHGYHEAIIFGHALAGNLHFVFTQDFSSAAEVERYARFMDEVCHLVVEKYDGSLKAEHGTGRNMAPFVELEWGQEATELMWRIKALLDPSGILNPGVILNRNPDAHIQDLKRLPAVHGLVDRCIECGFCEPQCPSAGLTFSPRQRIVAARHLAERQAAGEHVDALLATYRYQGMDTCAGCGLCATVCPVGIETGALIREQRAGSIGPIARFLGQHAARHYAASTALARWSLGAGKLGAAILGHGTLSKLSGGAWKPALAPARNQIGKDSTPQSRRADLADSRAKTVVYFSGCAGRMFGAADGSDDLPTVITRLLDKAGLEVRLPKEVNGLCCGQPFYSKGLFDTATAKANELEAALVDASEGGRLPILFDASPCALRMRQHLGNRLTVADFGEFAHDHLLPRLKLEPLSEPVALHVNCSARRLGEADKLVTLARACAPRVIVPAEVKCCGFGGDRGFAVPELNAHALRDLHLPADCRQGYSSNRTCELGLSSHTGIPYRSIAYLLDACAR